jgi:putative hemolysin
VSDTTTRQSTAAGPAERAEPSYPCFPELVPAGVTRRGPYSLRFARSSRELAEAQRLRFEVFNLELGEGLERSFATGRDEDRFDPVCHHLLVLEPSGRVIGTYRMQTAEMAERNLGFYSADEFRLEGIPADVLARAIEVGRACVAKEFRNRHALFLLWQGLAAYMLHNRKRYLFGCCSLTSQDPLLGRRVMDHLAASGQVHPTIEVQPQPDWRCYDEASPSPPTAGAPEAVKLPKLFSLYLRYGAKVCGPPALDRFFKTIDYLVLLDVEGLGADSRAMFFPG